MGANGCEYEIETIYSRYMDYIYAEGKIVILQKEVTIEVNGVRVRVDIATQSPNMEITLFEVKNGPYANLTPNQKIVYPQMMLDHAPIVPIGQNAARVWPQIGQPTTNYVFIIIKIY